MFCSHNIQNVYNIILYERCVKMNMKNKNKQVMIILYFHQICLMDNVMYTV